MSRVVGKAIELMLRGTLATLKAVEIAQEVKQAVSSSWTGDPPFPFPNSSGTSDRIYVSNGTDVTPVETGYEANLAHMAAMLEEREQKMQALVALAGMLYLFYKQQIQDESMGFDPHPEPLILDQVRGLVDKYFDYYKGKSKQDYCLTFERIVGNGKENLLSSEPASDSNSNT